MAAVAVPPVLHDVLGDAASDALVELLDQATSRQRAELLDLVEERFARRLAELRDDLRGEMHAGFLDLQKQIGAVRADLGKEIADVRKEIGDVRKEITTQTRWLLGLLVGAAVLIPILQRIMEVLLP